MSGQEKEAEIGGDSKRKENEGNATPPGPSGTQRWEHNAATVTRRKANAEKTTRTVHAENATRRAQHREGNERNATLAIQRRDSHEGKANADRATRRGQRGEGNADHPKQLLRVSRRVSNSAKPSAIFGAGEPAAAVFA
jgi:hypothetical protein